MVTVEEVNDVGTGGGVLPTLTLFLAIWLEDSYRVFIFISILG